MAAVGEALKASDAVAVTMFELLHNMRHRKLTRHEKEVRGFFRQLRVLPLDDEGAEEAARMMGGLLRAGRQADALDVLMAGTAAANAAEKIIAADADFAEIGKVSDLKVEVIG